MHYKWLKVLQVEQRLFKKLDKHIYDKLQQIVKCSVVKCGSSLL